MERDRLFSQPLPDLIHLVYSEASKIGEDRPLIPLNLPLKLRYRLFLLFTIQCPLPPSILFHQGHFWFPSHPCFYFKTLRT
jgi:hypothetical protein